MTASQAFVVVLAALGGCIAACAPGWDDAPPPSALYPCGPFGVVCATQHGCCSEGETCGGEPSSVGCPAGACCAVETSLMGARMGGDAGARVRSQRPQVSP